VAVEADGVGEGGAVVEAWTVTEMRGSLPQDQLGEGILDEARMQKHNT
jgi:hypothetical protein